jgi:hypothetical protein
MEIFQFARARNFFTDSFKGATNILLVKTDSPGLSHWTPHYTIQHLFVIPTANYAAKLLLRMGKECPKHVEFLD